MVNDTEFAHGAAATGSVEEFSKFKTWASPNAKFVAE
jgi:hypothetical protein